MSSETYNLVSYGVPTSVASISIGKSVSSPTLLDISVARLAT